MQVQGRKTFDFSYLGIFKMTILTILNEQLYSVRQL